VGANYRLVGPYHRLLPPNDKLPKFVSEKGGHVNAKTEPIKAETEGAQKICLLAGKKTDSYNF
jgi:putative 30S ribosomal protein S16